MPTAQCLRSESGLSPVLIIEIMDKCINIPGGECFISVVIKSKTKPKSLSKLLEGVIYALSPLGTFFQKAISATYLESDKEVIRISIGKMKEFLNHINDNEQEEITEQNEFLNNEKFDELNNLSTNENN